MVVTTLLMALALAAEPPRFAEHPCTSEVLAKLARCGTVEVAEDRANPDLRRIALNVIVLPATSLQPHLPPLFEIDGGPGLPVTKSAEFYAAAGKAFRERRDIVLIDQRGTGGSNPLHCHELSGSATAYLPLYPDGTVARCRKALAAKANLRQYGTRNAVADLDAVRAALGYKVIDLFGLSYGSTVAMRYMEAHPGRVRAAVLMGVNPPEAMPPKNHAPAAAKALDSLFTACRAEPACRSSFDPPGDLARALVRLPSIEGAPPRDVFLEKLRSAMYLPGTARRIPLILNRTAAGDLGPFFAATAPQGPSPYAEGMFLSVICAESMAVMDVAAARLAARKTVFGDYRLRRQAVACADWPVARVAREPRQKRAPRAAVLLLSGEFDPVTPPEWAETLAIRIANARHVVLPGSGHIFDGMSGVESCLDPLIIRFLDTGDPRTLEVGCVEGMRPPPFATADSGS